MQNLILSIIEYIIWPIESILPKVLFHFYFIVDELLKFISQCEPELEKNKEKLIKFLEDEDEFIGSEISDIGTS